MTKQLIWRHKIVITRTSHNRLGICISYTMRPKHIRSLNPEGINIIMNQKRAQILGGNNRAFPGKVTCTSTNRMMTSSAFINSCSSYYYNKHVSKMHYILSDLFIRPSPQLLETILIFELKATWEIVTRRRYCNI